MKIWKLSLLFSVFITPIEALLVNFLLGSFLEKPINWDTFLGVIILVLINWGVLRGIIEVAKEEK